MGLDLTLHPVKWRDLEWWFLSDSLYLTRNYDLFDEIKKLQIIPVPENKIVQIYSDEGLEKITTDPYGDKLTYVRAEEFRKLHFEFDTDNYYGHGRRRLWSLSKDCQKTCQLCYTGVRMGE